MNKRITAKPLTASEVIDQIMGRLGADRVSLIQRLSDCVYRAVMVDDGITEVPLEPGHHPAGSAGGDGYRAL